VCYPHALPCRHATGRTWPVGLVILVAYLLLPGVAQAYLVKAEVLIYFANETAPEGDEARNYDVILGWLRSGEHPIHARTVASLERDRRIFPAAVDIEVSDLMDKIPESKRGPEAVIFTNRLVRQGKCLLWKHGSTSFNEVSFAISPNSNYILASNPLSRTDALPAVLAFVAKEFDPHQHNFILVTKSHGSNKKAIIPRLAVRAEETNQEELLKVAKGQMTEGELPEWAGKLGVSKMEYFTILAEAYQRHGMHFSLVYMEACNAYTDDIRLGQLPENVDRLLLLGKDAHYINILYGDIIKSIGNDIALADAMTRNLPAKFITIQHVNTPPLGKKVFTIPLWVYCAPAAVWVAWACWRWRPWRSTGRNGNGSTENRAGR